jgi:uncharacterized membrane protein
MMICFHIASCGTILGAFAAAFLFHGSIEKVEQIAGIMTGSYIGGGVNFVALKSHYQVSSELANPLIVADNFIMAGVFAILFLISGSRFFLNRYPHPHSIESARAESQVLTAQYWRRKDISLLDIAKSLGIAFAIAAVSIQLGSAIRAAIQAPLVQAVFGSSFVLMTALTVAAATLFHRHMDRIHGPEEIGAYLLYLFFFVIGLRADLWQVVRNVPLLFLFCLTMAATNLGVMLLFGRLFRLNLEEVLLAVNATLGGAPSAAAMAISKGWSNLVLPGILAGIWGYVIGTAIGIVVTETLLRMLP